MNFIKRKGVALISVVLIGALVFVSIMSIYLKVVNEKTISSSRISTARALAGAEGVLAQVAFDLSDVKSTLDGWNTTSVDHFLTVDQIKSVLSSGYASTPEKGFSVSPDTEIQVKMKTISVDTKKEPPEYTIRVYVLSTVYKQPGTSIADAIVRKAITTEYIVGYRSPSSYVFNYALFTPNSISLGGNATINGNTYAGTGITGQGSADINGTAYVPSGANVTPNDLADHVAFLPDPLSFPPLDLEGYKIKASNFKIGQPPYDGHTEGYANTSDSVVMTVIQSYLGTGTSSTIDQIQNFYNDLKNRSGGFLLLSDTQWGSLWNNAKSIVYYIDGDAHVNANFTAQGTIVVNGDFMINGNASIYNGGGLAVLVNGDIIKSNGHAELHGLFYATGSVGGSGTFDCTGSIVSQQLIELKGAFKVDYEMVEEMKDYGNPGGTSGIEFTKKVESSWEEISIDEFDSAS
jgi:hypothetical protein